MILLQNTEQPVECNASISVYYDSAEDKDVRFLWFAYLYLGLFDAYMMFQIE